MSSLINENIGIAEVHDEPKSLFKIKIFGIGGGGNNAIDKMSQKRSKNDSGRAGIEFYLANTDKQALDSKQFVDENYKILLGKSGKGAGGSPEMGAAAAQDSRDELKKKMEGADMIFLATGMGGGTGTGAIPVFAEVAREAGILSVAIVTRPFKFEADKRKAIAEEGIRKLREYVDCLVVIPNDRLSEVLGKKLPLYEAFSAADDVIDDAVNSVMEIILKVGFINMDLSDVQSVMQFSGMGIISSATASGEHRATIATQNAISSPLLENIDISRAKGILFNLTGNKEFFLMDEMEEASNVIYGLVNRAETQIKYGVTFDDTMGDELRVSVFVTGIDDGYAPKASVSESQNLSESQRLGVPEYLRT